MKIQLQESQVLNLFVKKLYDEDGPKQIDMSCSSIRDSDTEFSILFLLNISLPREFSLEIKFKASFTTKVDDLDLIGESLPLEDEFQNHPFINVNAPAIAYPFLRIIVATILLNCGYNPIVLPAVNFQALYNTQKQ